ncbi:hypothetical protein GA0115240_135248 [Streptomyces sp. DvalAA-14]|uniref:hypothetical protein n=1 Tax=unclassified Streptomyces TaxID=2593676 RepID=UPI00081B7D8A|nr:MULTISPECIES: hypothetical protein [unclassified Streptomyces]MYS21787.1 hypothetical protein [Streptomyces sp. SID4948]SCE01247.1 hypothetical protein GA0115240_135248 [Streptomyces sp. DvalAA-14]
MPPRLRETPAGRLTMVAIVAVIVVAVESVSSDEAAARGADLPRRRRPEGEEPSSDLTPADSHLP